MIQEPADVARIRKLVGVIVSIASIGIAITNYFGAPPDIADRPLIVIASPQVSLLVITALVALATVLWARLRWIQVAILIFNGHVGAVLNIPGNLTSFVLVLLGLFLALEYGSLGARPAQWAGVHLAVYGVAVVFGLAVVHGATPAQTISTLLGAVTVGMLSWAIIHLRARDRQRRQKELESKVEERTADLSDALAEQKLLLAELHHRTKNNLQLVSSILSLSKDEDSDPAAAAVIESRQVRINALGRIHDQLYAATGRGEVDLRKFLQTYLQDAEMMGGSGGFRLKYDLDIADTVSSELAIRLALALNEIVVEAVEWTEVSGDSIRLMVSAEQQGQELLVTTSDDGRSEGGPRERSDGSGVAIIRAMVRRIGGEADLEVGGGVSWRIKLPMDFGHSRWDA